MTATHPEDEVSSLTLVVAALMVNEAAPQPLRVPDDG